MSNQLLIPFDAPLKDCDTETQTFGCRHYNPDMCSLNSMDGICALVTSDHICRKPSRAWKKQYQKLKIQLIETQN
jgi:hypothetical protein